MKRLFSKWLITGGTGIQTLVYADKSLGLYSTLALIFLYCCLLPVTSSAHGPTPQKALASVTIDAPVAAVWETVKRFERIADWHPGVKQSSGGGRYESGGQRTLILANGGQLLEELDFYSDQKHEYSYRLKTENVEAFPVSSYSTRLQVLPGDAANTAVVQLKSRFYRGDTGNQPPERLNDAAAVNAMNEFFQTGLQGLKQLVEKRHGQ